MGLKGQIARYMQVFRLKYGFLTTYNKTIFLKQEGTNSDAVLYFSPAIESSGQTPSLRECIVYMQSLVEQPKDSQELSTPWHFENNVGKDNSGAEWVVTGDKKNNESASVLRVRVENAIAKIASLPRDEDSVDFQSVGEICSDLGSLSINPSDDRKPTRTLMSGSRTARFDEP